MLIIGPETRGAIPTIFALTWQSRVQGIGDIFLVQQPRGAGREGNHDKRDQIPVRGDFHGAKKRPIRLPNRTASPAKKRGKCQTWRVQPRCSKMVVTAQAHKKPRTIITIDQGVLKS